MVRLHDIVTLDVVTVSPETTLRDAAGLLADECVSEAPVVAGSRVDVLKAGSQHGMAG